MQTLKDQIALKALEDAPFDGWSMEALRLAAENLGQKPTVAQKLFPDGARGALRHVAALYDRRMMEQLANVDTSLLRVRERIALAVTTRLDLMAPVRAGLRVAMTCPSPRALWQSADVIWVWAGDTATDYNRYTKRLLLAGVMASTMLYWFQDSTPHFAGTRDFLARRIDNVMALGSLIGKRKRTA